MHHPANGLRRIPLPRTRVNKGMKKARGCYRTRPSPSPSSRLGSASAAYPSLILKTCNSSPAPSLGSGVGLSCPPLLTIRPTHHSGELAALEGVVAKGVVVDPHPGGALAIAAFGLDAGPTVPLDDVLRHLDVLGGYEHYAPPALSDVLLAVAVSEHEVVGDLAGWPPTDFVADAALAVVVDHVAADFDRLCEPVTPDPVPVVVVDLIVPEGRWTPGYLHTSRRGGRAVSEGGRAVMVDLGVLKEKSGTRVTDSLVRVMVEPYVNDVEVPTVLLDGTPAFWLAPLATPGPANAEAADGYPLGIPYVEGHQRPVGIYFRASLVGVDPLEGIPTIGVDRSRELVGAVLDSEGGGGRAVRCHPGKVLAWSENRVASRGSRGNGYP